MPESLYRPPANVCPLCQFRAVPNDRSVCERCVPAVPQRDELSEVHAACMEHVRIRNEMGKLIARLVATHDGEPCRLDHHGYCQSHNYAAPCPVADARVLLSE